MDAENELEAGMDSPLTNLNFTIEIDGIPETGFCSLEGLESAIIEDSGRRREGGRGRTAPPANSFTNLILRRAIGESKSLWQWHRTALLGKDARRDMVVTVLNEARRPALTIMVKDALPRRWKLSKLDALKGEILIDEVELAIRDFRLE